MKSSAKDGGINTNGKVAQHSTVKNVGHSRHSQRQNKTRMFNLLRLRQAVRRTSMSMSMRTSLIIQLPSVFTCFIGALEERNASRRRTVSSRYLIQSRARAGLTMYDTVAPSSAERVYTARCVLLYHQNQSQAGRERGRRKEKGERRSSPAQCGTTIRHSRIAGTAPYTNDKQKNERNAQQSEVR